MAQSRLIAAAIIITIAVVCSGNARTQADPVKNGGSIHSQYLAEFAKFKAAGIPTSLSEIYPKQPPDDQNAFPIYIKIGDVRSFPSGNDEILALAVLNPGATETDWKNAHAFLHANADLVAAVHEAASKPQCVMPGRADTKNPSAALMSEMAPIRRAARLLSIESQVLAYDGKSREAIKNAGLGFHISDHAYQNPILLGMLVGIASDAITINSVESIMLLNRHQPNVVAEAGQMLESSRHSHTMIDALKGEAAFGISQMAFIRNSIHGSADLDALAAGGELPATLHLSKMTTAEWNDFVDSNNIQWMKYFREIIADAADPYPTLSAKFAKIDAGMAAQHGNDVYLLQALDPPFTKVAVKEAQNDARAAIVQASAALYIWRAKHGEYPATLQEATDTVPADPFDLKPIRYRRDGAGFVLYSVGDSGKYDGGAHTDFQVVLRVSGDGVANWK